MSKASKHRFCPAVAREITSAECGSNRITHYRCPSDCPFNPFAPMNYSKFLELESEVDKLISDRAASESPNRYRVGSQLAKSYDTGNMGEYHRLLQWYAYYERDASGLTCGEKWEREGFTGLKNDQKVIARARTRTVMRLLEFRRILSLEQITAVDLLENDGREMLIQDRLLASKAKRFQTLLIWTYDLPHYTRTSGIAYQLPIVADVSPLEVLLETVKHMGGPTENPELQRWLTQNVMRLEERVFATAKLRRRAAFSALDADFSKSVYHLTRPLAECREVLDSIPEVDEEPLTRSENREGFSEARVWLESNPSELAASPSRPPILGRVLIGQTYWRLESLGVARTSALRARFENALGDRVRFETERVDRLAQKVAQDEPNVDAALAVPSLLQRPSYPLLSSSHANDMFQGMRKGQTERERDERFLDEAIPALDDHTPREAARDPALRPALILMMKNRVQAVDELNLERGEDYDINWLLEELGLRELILPPPPPRPRVKSPTANPEKNEDYLEDMPPPPPLPDRPFTGEEILERQKAMMKAYPYPDDAIEAVIDNGSDLMDFCDSIFGKQFDEDEKEILKMLAAQAWFCFAPPNTFGPDLELERIANDLDQRVQAVSSANKAGSKDLSRLIDTCVQPALATGLFMQAAELLKKYEKHERATVKALLMALVLQAVINELDRAMREP